MLQSENMFLKTGKVERCSTAAKDVHLTHAYVDEHLQNTADRMSEWDFGSLKLQYVFILHELFLHNIKKIRFLIISAFETVWLWL